MDINKLENKLGYGFKDKKLIHTALCHSSYVNEQNNTDLKDNERFEFLGDAVLSLTASHILMEKYPDLKEGDLSRMRASLVNENRLATVAKSINLGDFLLLGKGEIQTNGREKKSILANAFEAILAAVYLDGGYDASFQIISSHFSSLLKSDAVSNVNLDYKSQLQELVQMTHKVIPLYTVINEFGPDHDKTFCVQLKIQDLSAQGAGKSKKLAEQDAAKQALEMLRE